MEKREESIGMKLGKYLLIEGLIEKFNSGNMTQEDIDREVEYIVKNKLYEKYN